MPLMIWVMRRWRKQGLPSRSYTYLLTTADGAVRESGISLIDRVEQVRAVTSASVRATTICAPGPELKTHTLGASTGI